MYVYVNVYIYILCMYDVTIYIYHSIYNSIYISLPPLGSVTSTFNRPWHYRALLHQGVHRRQTPGVSDARGRLRWTQQWLRARQERATLQRSGVPVRQVALKDGWMCFHNYGKSPFLMGKSTINGHFP